MVAVLLLMFFFVAVWVLWEVLILLSTNYLLFNPFLSVLLSKWITLKSKPRHTQNRRSTSMKLESSTRKSVFFFFLFRVALWILTHSTYVFRLWHQLGCKLDSLIRLEFFKTGKHLVNLFEKFVSKCQTNLNQLKFSQFAVAASYQVDGIPLPNYLHTCHVHTPTVGTDGLLIVLLQMLKQVWRFWKR